MQRSRPRQRHHLIHHEVVNLKHKDHHEVVNLKHKDASLPSEEKPESANRVSLRRERGRVGVVGCQNFRAAKGAKLRIAVGIATIGRPELLCAALEELARQSRRPDRVVVCAPNADDVSVPTGDATVQIVLGPRGLTKQRNAILDAVCDFDVVVFFDDDFFPAPSYLAVVERVFESHPEIVMLTGFVLADGIIGPGLGLDEARRWLSALGALEWDWRELQEATNGYGCNMALRIAAARAAQCRFDEKLPLYGWLEDVDFSLRLRQRGRIVKAIAARGVHLGIKQGRQSGVRLGYSQIANPIYLSRKGAVPWRRTIRLMSRNVAANLLRLMHPEPYIDRLGRTTGNMRALRDLLTGRLSPERILEM
jgi:GT2 family glycosyltransferase